MLINFSIPFEEGFSSFNWCDSIHISILLDIQPSTSIDSSFDHTLRDDIFTCASNLIKLCNHNSLEYKSSLIKQLDLFINEYYARVKAEPNNEYFDELFRKIKYIHEHISGLEPIVLRSEL